MRLIEGGVVWLDGSKNPRGPIRRRWRLRLSGVLVLSVPLRTVPWSRNGGAWHAMSEEARAQVRAREGR